MSVGLTVEDRMMIEFARQIAERLGPSIGAPLTRDRVLELADRAKAAIAQLGAPEVAVLAERCTDDTIVFRITLPAWMAPGEDPP